MWCACWSQGEFSASATWPVGENCSSLMVQMSGDHKDAFGLVWFDLILLVLVWFGFFYCSFVLLELVLPDLVWSILDYFEYWSPLILKWSQLSGILALNHLLHLRREEKFTDIEEMFRRTQVPALKEIGFRYPLPSCIFKAYQDLNYEIYTTHMQMSGRKISAGPCWISALLLTVTTTASKRWSPQSVTSLYNCVLHYSKQKPMWLTFPSFPI